MADTDAFAEQARALGATIVLEPMDTPTGFRGAAIADPQGAVFSSAQRMIGGRGCPPS